MEVQSELKYARISPLKAQPLARRLKGLSVGEALNIVKATRCKSAALIEKTLKAAVADVENNHKRSAEEFRVKSVAIDAGPGLKRFWSRSRGMVRPVKKRTSHVKVILETEQGGKE